MTPLESYVALSFLFSILVFANGISHIYFSLSNSKTLEGWGWYLASGIMEVVIGLVLIIHPDISITTLPFIVGFWLMFKSASVMAIAFDLRRYGVLDWGWLLALGIGLSLLAFLMVIHPIFGAATIVMWTGAAIMFFGFSYIFLSLKLKKIKNLTFDKVDKLKDEASRIKDEVLANLQAGVAAAGEEANKLKEEVGKKVDELIENVEKKSDDSDVKGPVAS